jgi:hypothetical protein
VERKRCVAGPLLRRVRDRDKVLLPSTILYSHPSRIVRIPVRLDRGNMLTHGAELACGIYWSLATNVVGIRRRVKAGWSEIPGWDGERRDGKSAQESRPGNTMKPPCLYVPRRGVPIRGGGQKSSCI